MNWEEVTLGEIFEISRGGSPRPIERYITEDENGLNWISIKDASNSNKYIYKTEKKIKPEGLSKTRQVYPDDFLLTNSMSFGRPYIMKTTGCIHDGWLVLSPDKMRVNSDFFYYLLGSNLMYRKFSSLAAGAVVKNLNRDLVKSVKVLLPPLFEQKRIADILDKADELRQKRQLSIAKLDELLQATFIDMFGDPVTNPKGWEKEKLEKLTQKIGSGSTPKGGDSSYQTEGISLIRSLNIHDNKFIYKNLAFINDQQAEKLKNVVVKEKDVLLNITGASVARCCIVPKDVLPARVNQHVSILRVKDNLLAEFLASLLISKPMKNYLLNTSGAGATREALTKMQLQNLDIILPSKNLQENWKQFAKKIETQKQLLNQQLNQQNQLFQSLQHQAFNGTL